MPWSRLQLRQERAATRWKIDTDAKSRSIDAVIETVFKTDIEVSMRILHGALIGVVVVLSVLFLLGGEPRFALMGAGFAIFAGLLSVLNEGENT